MSDLISLGQKHTCSGCSAKFYDLGKQHGTCPKCHTVVAVSSPTRQEISTASRAHKSAIQRAKGKKEDVEDMGFRGGEIDTIDTLEEDDDVLVSLSELEDRENHDHPETDDDVHEEDLMEDMKGYDTILDTPEEETDEDVRA